MKLFLKPARWRWTESVEVGDETELKALMRSAVSQFDGYVKLNRKNSAEVQSNVSQIDDPIKLADTIAGHLKYQP